MVCRGTLEGRHWLCWAACQSSHSLVTTPSSVSRNCACLESPTAAGRWGGGSADWGKNEGLTSKGSRLLPKPRSRGMVTRTWPITTLVYPCGHPVAGLASVSYSRSWQAVGTHSRTPAT